MKLYENKKELFSIPNLLGYFRLILIPVYLILYFQAEDKSGYFAAGIVLAVSSITDMLDGKIARRFNMITEWGKILDPIADKLTQGAVVISLTFRFPLMRYVLVLFVIKELFMGIMGVVMMKKGKVMNGAQWYGKVCTAVLFVVLVILLVSYDISYLISGLLICFCIMVMLFSLFCYSLFYIRMIKGVPMEKNKISIKKSAIAFLGAVCVLVVYVLVAGVAAYAKQPEIAEDFMDNMNVAEFYSDTKGNERAAIIEDNVEALLARVKLINDSKEEIILSTFDFHSDESGKIIMGALFEAADKGVSIKILTDGFSYFKSMEWNPYFYALGAYDNIEFKVYNKVNILTPWKGMGRMHDKYLISDNNMYILGGRNIYDYFLGDYQEYKNHDRDVLVFIDNEGSSGYEPDKAKSSMLQLKEYFSNVWNYKECKTVNNKSYIMDWTSVKKAEKDIKNTYKEYIEDNERFLQEINYKESTFQVDKITLVSNPIHYKVKEPVLWHTLEALMLQAKKEVKIHTPYIICNDVMYNSLSRISSNADTLLMTNSVANNGNPFGAGDYSKYKEDVLETGVKVWEYEGGTSYHGKSILMDEDISIIGSFNFDMRSVYLDTEVMLVIDSEELNEMLDENMTMYEQKSRQALKDGEYYNPYEVEPMELSDKRAKRIFFIQTLIGWARFLF